MFGEILRDLRISQSLSQPQLAKAIGVSNGNVGDWERGRSKPGYDALIALSTYFRVTADHLLEIDQVERSDTELTPHEKSILSVYRTLSDAQQISVQDFMLYQLQKGTQTQQPFGQSNADGTA